MVPVFLSRDYVVHLFGWERLNNELDQCRWGDERVKEVLILKGGGYVSRKARLMYPLWMMAVFIKTLRLGKNKTLFCLGWETAFPALIASLFTKSKIIFDDADRFSMIVKLPKPFNSVLVSLEKWASRKSFIHLIPGWTRYDWRNDKMLILRNSPNSEDFALAKKASPCRDAERLVVYINGWVGNTRGAPIFLKALNSISKQDARVVFHIAGRVDSPEGQLLIEHEKSIFYGEVSQSKALEIYSISDVVLTYYDPAIEVNRHAESNKWGDCVFFETPFIVNSEVVTAEKFTSSGAAWKLKYSDVDGLVDLLIFLSRDRDALKAGSYAIAQHKDDYPVFDLQLKRMVDKIEEGENV
ncbi:hypothetical protein CF98_05385 [Halopseudomonas bauzanensis]|nr:hypothetical protein CF98_05385 [Halopseudomonas bauzanensis]